MGHYSSDYRFFLIEALWTSRRWHCRKTWSGNCLEFLQSQSGESTILWYQRLSANVCPDLSLFKETTPRRPISILWKQGFLLDLKEFLNYIDPFCAPKYGAHLFKFEKSLSFHTALKSLNGSNSSVYFPTVTVFLAALSTLSLSSMPLCAGIQNKDTFLPRSLSSYRQSRIFQIKCDLFL